MGFALCPDDGPPRLWRFLSTEEWNSEYPPGGAAVLVVEQNLLKINKEVYDQLGWVDQHMLLRTHARNTDTI